MYLNKYLERYLIEDNHKSVLIKNSFKDNKFSFTKQL